MKRSFTLILVLAFIFSCAPNSFAATDEEIQALKQQVEQLMQRIAKLEAEQVRAKDE